MPKRIILAALIAGCCNVALADSGADLRSQVNQALSAKDYVRAGPLLEQLFKLDGDPKMLYYAASTNALTGQPGKAMDLLERAFAAGFVDAAGVAKDDDLVTLHNDPRWGGLLEGMKHKAEFDARLFNSTAFKSPYREDLSEDEKVAGLSKLWSEVKYNFVYTDRLKELDWDKLYLETLPRVRATRSTAEYYRVLTRLVAQLKDGHTNVWFADELYDKDWAKPMLKVRLVEGRVLVDQVFDPELQGRGVAPGTEITAVDGAPVRAWAEREIRPYANASTPQDLEARVYGYLFLQGPIAEQPQLTFRSAAGKTFNARVRRVTYDEFDRHAPKPVPFEWRMLPGNVAYVALNDFGNPAAVDRYIAAFDQIGKARALVIDVRNNGGGNSGEGYRVLGTLTAKPFAVGKGGTRDYRPAFRAWHRASPDFTEPDVQAAPDPKHQFSGPVAVLTSAHTYSAAEDFVLAFDAMKRGLLVGETTGGSTGQPLMFDLPGGGHARVCVRSFTYPDGTVWVGKGIVPNVKASPTVADVRAGRDTVLAAALAALR